MLNALLLFSIGIGVYIDHDNLFFILSSTLKISSPQTIGTIILIVGCLGSMSALFYALIIHLFKNIFTRDLFEKNAVGNTDTSFIGKLLIIARYFTGFGLIEPILLLAALLNYLSVIVLVFSSINIAAAIYVSIKAIVLAKKETPNN